MTLRHQLTRLGRSRHKSCISQLLFHVCWRFLSKRCLIFAGFLLSWDMWWYKLVNHLDVKKKNLEKQFFLKHRKSIEQLETFRINVVWKSTYRDLPTLSNQIADWAIRSPQRFCHAIKQNLFGNVLNVWSIKHGSLAAASTHCRNLGLRAASTSWWEWKRTWRNMTLTMFFSQRREMFCILFSVSLFCLPFQHFFEASSATRLCYFWKSSLARSPSFLLHSAQYVFKRVSISPEL